MTRPPEVTQRPAPADGRHGKLVDAAMERAAPAASAPPGEPILLHYAAPPGGFETLMNRLIPINGFARSAVAILVPIPFAVGITHLSVYVAGEYGWGIFVGTPFAQAMLACFLYGWRRKTPEKSFAVGTGAAFLSIIGWAVGLFFLGYEGSICLIMAFPLVLMVAAIGAVAGTILREWIKPEARSLLMLLAVALPPGLLALEHSGGHAPAAAPVTTCLEIDAPPDVVWREVVSFPDLPPPRELVFRSGVAYPTRARIEGHGVGAVRHCEFSTGAFVEPIEVWDEPRLLRFAVTAQPPTMQEWSLYSDIHPPHLHGYLVSHAGQFELTPLPGGRTRLAGTTWYHNDMRPSAYWRLWSDYLIHRIHRRVLEHIKQRSEDTARQAFAGAGGATCQATPAISR